MSTIRTAAMGAVLTFGLAVFAGAQVPAKPDSAGRGMRDGQPQRGIMDGQQHRRMHGRKGGPVRRSMGRGHGRGQLISDLNLSDAQKTQIKTIHQKYQPQHKSLREQARSQFQPMRDARQKGDTSAAARQRFQAQREQFSQRVMSIRTQEQNDVRAVLTVDQRTKWDAAATSRKKQVEGRREKIMQRRGDRARTKA